MPVAADSPAAYVQYDAGAGSSLQTTVTSGTDWSIAMWIKPEAIAANSSIFQLSAAATPTRSAVHITTTNGGSDLQVELFDASGVPIASRTTSTVGGSSRPISTAFPSWTLAIVWHDSVSTTQAMCGVIAVNSVGQVFDAGSVTYNPTVTSIAAHNRARIGKPTLMAGTTDAMTGTYGPLVVRSHKSTALDASGIWTARSIGGLLNYAGGTWNNTAGVKWAIFNAHASHPVNKDTGATTAGLPIEFSTQSNLTPSNCLITDTDRTNASWFDVHTARTSISGTWTVKGVEEFFPLGTPVFDGVTGQSVRGRADTLYGMAMGVMDRPTRLLVISNSRGVRHAPDIRHDRGSWPQHWGGGLVHAAYPLITGTFAGKPTVGSSNSEFGIDHGTLARAVTNSQTILQERALRRFGYGSQLAAATGPGNGIFVGSSGYYQTLTKQMPGSRYLFSSPRRYRVTLLAYPGSTDAKLELRTSATSRSDTGAVHRSSGDWTALDTTRLSATVLTAVPSSQEITIVGTGHDIRVGDAISIGVSASDVDVSIIQSISENAGITTLTLEHWFDEALGSLPGASIRIGEWNMVQLDVACSGEESWNAESWQGLRLLAGTATTLPVCLLAEEWYAEVPGVVIGSTGWSGNGFTEHLEEGFSTTRDIDGLSPFDAFLLTLDPDSVILVPAQQNTDPWEIGTMTLRLKTVLGDDLEMAWVADYVHAKGGGPSVLLALKNQNYASWYSWMQDNAAAYNVPYLAKPMYALGNAEDQLARGWRSNSVAHGTSEANRIWAKALLHDARRTLTPVQINKSNAGQPVEAQEEPK